MTGPERASGRRTIPPCCRCVVVYAMIPFDRLAVFFKLWGGAIYPEAVRVRLSSIGRALKPGGRVLDLGGGTGVLADLIYRVRQDLDCFVADPSSKMLIKGSRHIRKAAGLAESLPFKDNTFDAVLIGDALHHFNDPLKGFFEVMRVLKPRGVLFIFDIDPTTPMGKVIRGMERLFREPGRFYAPDELSEILTEYSFKVRVDRYDWRYSITGELR
jgi:ubiquinone/menaquinone biosynthesis C-methylase UbiE